MGKKIGELPEATSSDGLHLVAFDQTAKKTYKLSSSKVKGAEPKLLWLSPEGYSQVAFIPNTILKFRVVVQSTRGSGWDAGRTVIDFDLDKMHMFYDERIVVPFICTDEFDYNIPHVGHVVWSVYDDTAYLSVDSGTLAYSPSLIAVYEL